MGDKLGLVDLSSYAAEHRAIVDQRLHELLPNEDSRPEKLHRAMRYAVVSGGKRFRSLLCMASAEAVTGLRATALDAACAVELVHCFSLIHDDLPSLDDDELRRGRPACHIAFGEATAILAGDALFCLAFQVLAEMDESPAVCAQSVGVLARASGTCGMVGGQIVDLESENRQIDLATVEWIHSRKTGALIAASCELGALIAGADLALRDRTRSCGEKIGLAFQIRDDLLDEVGTEAQIGKPVGSDRERKKATYPGLLGLNEAKLMADEAIAQAVSLAASFGERGAALAALAQFSGSRET